MIQHYFFRTFYPRIGILVLWLCPLGTLLAQENLTLKVIGDEISWVSEARDSIQSLEIDGEVKDLIKTDSGYLIPIDPDRKGELVFIRSVENKRNFRLYHLSKGKSGQPRVRAIPLWLSLLPPLVAIVLALLLKEVLISLFMGILTGSLIAAGLRFDSLGLMLRAVLATVQELVIEALIDTGHRSVRVFSIIIGGVVAIISKNGGMAGVVKALARFAHDIRSSQLVTWFLGIAIFFDDYANILIVGNTMRSVTDKFKIAREKLAYIVDSTAAPVSAIAFITTWIGAELGYIDDGLTQIGLDGDYTPYGIFLSSLKYSFYPVLTVIFIFLLIRMDKNYGPMHAAEVRARTTGQVSSAATPEEDEPNMEDLSPVKNAPLRWYNAAIPILVIVFMTIFGLLTTGFENLYGELIGAGLTISEDWGVIWGNLDKLIAGGDANFFSKLGKVIGSSDSYIALLWASLSGLIVAIIMTVSQRIISLFDTMHWMVSGFKTMVPALLILTMAWALATTTDMLHTADYISNALQDSIHPFLLPGLIFIISAVIAFSTGSSWSTMAILYPIAIPTAYAVCQSSGLDATHTMEILLNVIATVLAASVLGDHCSPISDTTILSSLATDCNHIDHVKTQMPYALTVGFLSLIGVTMAAALGGGWLVSIAIVIVGTGASWFVIKTFGKSPFTD